MNNNKITTAGIAVTLGVIVILTLGYQFWSSHMLPASFERKLNLVHANISRSFLYIQHEPTTLLPASFHRQERSLSCEIATVKMAFSVYGLDISEIEIQNWLPFDSTPKNGNIWGDPHKGFVGRIDGTMHVNGYGVYWEPIARLTQHWMKTKLIEDGTVEELVSHLDAGRPIILWGYVGKGLPVSWTTPQGRVIKAVTGEHVRLLTGYWGNSSDPEGYFVIDPIYGELQWSKNKFLKQWDVFDRVGVVVYDHPLWARVPDNDTVWEFSEDGNTIHALKMTWDEFIARGGFWEAIRPMSKIELSDYPIGFPIVSQEN